MNIHYVLGRITAGDYDFFIDMTEEELKEISPYVICLWLRGANENRWAHTIMTDVYVNSKLFELHKHPKLLFMLACHANEGIDETRYSFKKDVKETETSTIKLIMREFQCNETAARMYQNFLDADDIKQLKAKFKEVDHA